MPTQLTAENLSGFGVGWDAHPRDIRASSLRVLDAEICCKVGHSGMGINASNLLLTNYQDLPDDILLDCLAKLPDDGLSRRKVGAVCKAWQRTAGTARCGCPLPSAVLTSLGCAGESCRRFKISCRGRNRDSLHLHEKYLNIRRLTVRGRASFQFLSQFSHCASLRELFLQPLSFKK